MHDEISLFWSSTAPARGFLVIFLDIEMVHMAVYEIFFLLCLPGTVTCSLYFDHENILDKRVLNVGKERQKEMLPFQMGSCPYQLHGLKPSTWYEVKISYPASIPASFSIHLKRGESFMGLYQNRRLLNAEKLIFKADGDKLNPSEGGIYVLVSVEPAGIVAISNVQERQYVIYNIVCDELLYRIPHKACWVGVLVLLCLGVALFVPYFLASYLCQRKRKKLMHM